MFEVFSSGVMVSEAEVDTVSRVAVIVVVPSCSAIRVERFVDARLVLAMVIRAVDDRSCVVLSS